MPLVKAGQIVDDRFVRVADGAAIPDGVPALLPAARWLDDADQLSRRQATTGLIWPNNRPVAELPPHLQYLALVALVFPSFKDGRAFSQARLLRERYGFAGELRATGQVLRDQFLFMLRAGFDALETSKATDAARRYSVFYQPTGDGRTTALRARLARAIPATRELELVSHAST